ncbi:coiled-coil domain-containing protein 136 [Salarias fasciatus]|uniref:coiled-coil domain-containing protein 136 n=1 Tax=Salarias fasciatus TaxID=181472 RepID=UPI001176D334|nr:coiled-coil domain-containing protein 136-like [Salarias fasciatus]
MDGFRLPPVIEEVLDSSEELSELKEEREKEKEPIMLGDTLTAKERLSLEDKEEPAAEAEKGQQQEEEKEVKEDRSEEEELEELRVQVVQLLEELEEAREVSQRHEDSFMELQGLLEEERLASAHQAESFTRQIQRLQAQLRSVQEELDSLEEEKESELEEAQQELRSAQEEVLVLQQAAEEAAAERENDIASLQEELCRLRAELQRLHATTAEYELEATTLRAEIRMKSHGAAMPGEATHLEEELSSLTDERLSLAADNRQLSSRVERLQQQRDTSDDVYLAVTAQGDAPQDPQVKADPYISLYQSGPEAPERRDESSKEVQVLKVQLRQAEETAHEVQVQCDGLKGELAALQQLYDGSQRERAALEDELQRCKAELQRLAARKAQQSDAEGWNLAVAAVAVAAIAVLVVPSFTRA